jgi:hypothetical protein
MAIRKSFKSIPVLMACLLWAISPLLAGMSVKGKIELGFHYSSWSIRLIEGLLETVLNDALKGQMLNLARAEYPGLIENSAAMSSAIDSSGSNFGFEIRWYPAGEKGSFSLGLSLEKTSMAIMMTGAKADISLDVPQEGTFEPATFTGVGNGEFRLEPWSFHVNFRWEFKPEWSVHPYLALGVGYGSGRYLDQGMFNYDVRGDFDVLSGGTEHFEESGTKTLKAVKDKLGDDAESEGKVLKVPFWFVPFFQLSLGAKGKIADNLYLLGEAAFWDGFILRGGIAYRF